MLAYTVHICVVTGCLAAVDCCFYGVLSCEGAFEQCCAAAGVPGSREMAAATGMAPAGEHRNLLTCNLHIRFTHICAVFGCVAAFHCCCFCGDCFCLRMPVSSAAQLLVCLAAEKQQLPLAWLLQVCLVFAWLFATRMVLEHMQCLAAVFGLLLWESP
jgi:hypothetical protein